MVDGHLRKFIRQKPRPIGVRQIASDKYSDNYPRRDACVIYGMSYTGSFFEITGEMTSPYVFGENTMCRSSES